MKAAAVAKARDRLATAKARLKDLQSPRGDYASARLHWYDFLFSSNAVFSVLEQGAKGSSKSQPWFGGKKNQRRTDPLLRYLHHARNAEEHGIDSTTELDKQKIVMVEDDKPVAEISDMIGNQGRFNTLTDNPSPDLTKINSMRVYPDRAKLIRVFDCSVWYDPPSAHLGLTLEDNGPAAVAALMVAYIEQMIEEASSFVADA